MYLWAFGPRIGFAYSLAGATVVRGGYAMNYTHKGAGGGYNSGSTGTGLLGFVALRGGKIMMLDLLGRRVAYTVDVGSTPHFVITGPFPPASNTTTATTAAAPAAPSPW